MKLFNKLNNNILTIGLGPLYIYIIIAILYIFIFIYFAEPCLCQETMYNLKIELITETHKHRINIINYEMLMDTYNLMVGRPSFERNFDAELQFLHASQRTTNDLRNSFTTINQLVARIKETEPTFQSPIQTMNFLRITR